jgi:outer membrane protein assembly factor BamB
MTQQAMSYTFAPDAGALPFFRRHRLALNYNTNHLKLYDSRTGEEEWSEQHRNVNFQYYVQFLSGGNDNRPAAHLDYQTVGHLVVLNLGQLVVALDPVSRKVLWEKSLIGTSGLPPGAQPQLDPSDGTLQVVYQDGFIMKIGQSGPVAASCVAVQTRDGLTGFDPLTGRTLWTRSDVPKRCHLFGDEEHIFLVELDNANQATATRAFRSRDGTAVKVPDFAAAYNHRQRLAGRLLLMTDNTPDALTMRLYDVLSGKDVWSKRFPAKSIMLRSEEPDLASVVSPDGKVTVVSLRTHEEVIVGMIDPKYLQNVEQVHLLADHELIYVLFQTKANGNVWSNLQPGTGLRGVPVNGGVYAFDRASGKVRWMNDVEHQQLVLEQWKEIPVLVFTSRHQEVRGGRTLAQAVGVEAYLKATGKMLFNQPDLGQPVQPFYSLRHDAGTGKIELTGHTYKVVFRTEPAPEKEK